MPDKEQMECQFTAHGRLSGMALYQLKLLAARRPARLLDGAVLILVTLAALLYCYEIEVFPNDSKPYTLELDELSLVSTIFFGGLFVCALRWRAEEPRGKPQTAAQPNAGIGQLGRGPNTRAPIFRQQVGAASGGRPSKNTEIGAAIDALIADGIDLAKIPRKDAYLRIRRKAAELGANVEIGFSAPVIQRVLLGRYGPRG